MFIATLETLNLEKGKEDFALTMYKDFYPLVKYIVNKIIDDPGYTEDIVQDTFVSLLDKLDLLESLALYQLNSYIAITAKRKTYAFNQKRSKKLGHEISYCQESEMDLLDTIPSNTQPLEEIITSKDQYTQIMTIMNQLPDNYKEILLLKYQYDLDDAEIAAQFHIKPTSVRMYLKRSREKLLKLVEGENIYAFKKRSV